jgi:hypothetical protein
VSKSSASGAAIDRLVKSTIAPWFRQHGFRRKGRFFMRRWGEVIHVASVQASQWNTPVSADFYLNLDVEWLACRTLWTDQPARSNPALAPWFVRSRLRDAQGRTGWNAMQDDPATLADVLVKALEGMAEEFWLRHSDLSDVLRRIEAGERLSLGSPPWLVHASLLMHFGRKVDAIAIIDRAASRGPRGFDYQRFRDRLSDPA